MLCFIIPLRSKATSADWGRVSRLMDSTLQSLFRQTDPDFRVLVVCHERPALMGTHDERLIWVEADFAPPAERSFSLGMADKSRKVTLGMLRAAELDPDFVMFVDSDDLVSRRLSAFVNAHRSANGWHVERGYKYAPGSWTIELHPSRFDRYCGTSLILGRNVVRYPDPNRPWTPEEYAALYSHHTVKDRLDREGTPLAPLPFAGAVYIIGTGENAVSSDFSGWPALKHRIKYWARQRLLTAALVDEFSLASQR